MDGSVTHNILYGPQLRFSPYNIVWVTSRSINCHMALSAMNYLLNIKLQKVVPYTGLKNTRNFHIFYLFYPKTKKTSLLHGPPPCVEKMQFIFFVPLNEELEGTLHPQKWRYKGYMYPQMKNLWACCLQYPVHPSTAPQDALCYFRVLKSPYQ
jgi:hypothetical protein